MPGVKDLKERMLERAQYLYEETEMPVLEIAAMLEMGERTFHRKRAELGWRSRREAMAARTAEKVAAARQTEPASIEPTLAEPTLAEPVITAPSATDRAVVIARVRETVDREIAGTGPARPARRRCRAFGAHARKPCEDPERAEAPRRRRDGRAGDRR